VGQPVVAAMIGEREVARASRKLNVCRFIAVVSQKV
jgi:hypothetical protein